MGIPVGSPFGQIVGKFRTGKFHSGIAFTICTNQRHLPKKNLKLVSKKTLKKWNTNIFRLEHSHRENKTTFTDVSLLKEMFPLKRPKKSCSIYSPTVLNSKRQAKGKRGHVVKTWLVGRDKHYSSASLCDNISSYLDDILTFQ